LAYAQALLVEAREELGRADAEISVLLATVGLAVSIVAAAVAAGSWGHALLATKAQATWWLDISIAAAATAVLANALVTRVRHPEGWLAHPRYLDHAAQFRSASELLAKRIGALRNPAQHEAVRVGMAAKYAAEAAHGDDRQCTVVTDSLWCIVEKNDYLADSSPCGSGPSLGISGDAEIVRLPEDDPGAQGRPLTSHWCNIHGEEYCTAIVAGQRHRNDADAVRKAQTVSPLRTAIGKTHGTNGLCK
jgi:hypothetical protein